MGRRSWLRSSPISDEEFVERIRRQVETHRRWRGALIALHGGLALCLIGLSIWAANQDTGLDQLFENRWIVFSGFGVGLLLGLVFGQVGYMIGCGLIAALLPPRTEQLLVRYHDAVAKLSDDD